MIFIKTRKHLTIGDSTVLYLQGNAPQIFKQTTFFDGDGKTNVDEPIIITVLDMDIFSKTRSEIILSAPRTGGEILIYHPTGNRPIASWAENRGDNYQGGNLSFGEYFSGRINDIKVQQGQNHLFLSNYPFLNKVKTNRLKKVVIEKDIMNMEDKFINTRLFISKELFNKISELIDDMASFTSSFKDINIIDSDFTSSSLETILGKVIKVLPKNNPEVLSIINGNIIHCDGVTNRLRSDGNNELTFDSGKDFKVMIFFNYSESPIITLGENVIYSEENLEENVLNIKTLNIDYEYLVFLFKIINFVKTFDSFPKDIIDTKKQFLLENSEIIVMSFFQDFNKEVIKNNPKDNSIKYQICECIKNFKRRIRDIITFNTNNYTMCAPMRYRTDAQPILRETSNGFTGVESAPTLFR